MVTAGFRNPTPIPASGARAGSRVGVSEPWGRRAARYACWACFLGVLLAWLALGTVGDRLAWASLLTFGPRWTLALPLALLAPCALLAYRPGLWPLALSGVLVAGPIQGFNVPWRGWIAARWELGTADYGADQRPGSLRVLTINRGLARDFRFEELHALLLREGVDVLAVQEASDPVGRYVPDRDLEGNRIGWSVFDAGEIKIASRHPLRARAVIDRDLAPAGRVAFGYKGSVARCLVDTPNGTVRFAALHLRSPRDGLESVLFAGRNALSDFQRNIDQREIGSRVASLWLRNDAGNPGNPEWPANAPLVVVGDFNQPPDSAIFRRDWTWLADAFETAGLGYGHTWRSRWHGLRIDHALADARLRTVRCEVGPDLNSDHLPLLAEFARRPRSGDRVAGVESGSGSMNGRGGR